MPVNDALLIFPHQLFGHHPGLDFTDAQVYLIEDGLFFGDRHHPAAMHQQKLWMHRASMKRYEATLRSQGRDVRYVEHALDVDVLDRCVMECSEAGAERLLAVRPHDYLLERRLKRAGTQQGLDLLLLDGPMFLNTSEQNHHYRAGRKRWFMADFYKHQRRRLDVLMDGDDPAGGQWSFDADNRKKVPKKMLGEIPPLPEIVRDSIDEAARDHVLKRYPHNPGSIDTLHYPSSHQAACEWLDAFLHHRFQRFGDYEDAIVQGENWLWHAVLTPMLNIGLLTPQQVLESALQHADEHEVPINSLEGFVRQLIGWREFMRAAYEDHGVQMRTSNHWDHHRPMPSCLYDGTSGIEPLDDVICRVLQTGYCHHIERLMVLGGFMFLCEIHPDHIYRWFMEMFVDSYDWVMVPNVYAMSQHADGGLITTKPYFSGSSYIKKMSNHSTGEWAEVWDGLYWRWIWNHHEALGKNPRWSMMCAMARKMEPSKMESHIGRAEEFLAALD